MANAMSTKDEENIDGKAITEEATLEIGVDDELNEKEVQVNEFQLSKSEVLVDDVKAMDVINKKEDCATTIVVAGANATAAAAPVGNGGGVGVVEHQQLNIDAEEILVLNDSTITNSLLNASEKHQPSTEALASDLVNAKSKLKPETKQQPPQQPPQQQQQQQQQQQPQQQQSEPNSKEKEERKLVKCTRSIWISNINPKTTAGQLKSDLSTYAKVITAKIVTNGENYYGYAKLEKHEQVKQCIEKLNKKKMHGYEIEVSTELPQKRKPKKLAATEKTSESEVTNNKIKNVKPVKKIQRRRSLSPDPLTLKVQPKKRNNHDEEVIRRRRRSRSGSWRARLLQQRKTELQLKRQRELERQIEIEKRKLEEDRKQLEREKYEFYKLQKEKIRERQRECTERKTHAPKRLKPAAYSPPPPPPPSSSSKKPTASSWRRSKSPNPLHKLPSHHDHHHHRRSRSKEIARHSHKSMGSGGCEKYRQEDIRPAPPPPPRLTNEDVGDTWKTYESRKNKLEYFAARNTSSGGNKKEYQSMENGVKLIFTPSGSSPDRIKKRYREPSYERTKLTYSSGGGGKYLSDDDKYGGSKENKRRSYDVSENKTCRSEVYAVPVRSAIYTCTNNSNDLPPTRRYDTISYSSQYNRNSSYTNNTYPMESSSSQQGNWNSRSSYLKDYDHNNRFDDYDKRHQYYHTIRKY